MLSDLYRERKLLERYLEAAALKCGLTVPEMTVLLYLSHSEEIITRKDLADFAGISRRTLGMQLQRLAMRGLICQEELAAEPQEETKKDKAKKKEKARKKKEQKEKKDREKRLRISFLPAAEPILEELAVVEWDYDNARFGGFDEEELIQYTRLAGKDEEEHAEDPVPGKERMMAGKGRRKAANCEYCGNLRLRRGLRLLRACEMDLDEDEMRLFIQGSFHECPYFQYGDEYRIVRKQM